MLVKQKIRSVLSILAVVFLWQPVTAQLVINELSASNTSVLYTGDKEYFDWIEVMNPGPEAIQLSDYFLSDDINIPEKWNFPSFLLDPGAYFLVLASGNDVNELKSCWTTIVDQGMTWRYLLPQQAMDGWMHPEYNDAQWLTGKSGIGYGDGDDATVIASSVSLYMRYSFTMDDISTLEDALFHIDYDDGFVAYLNGVEIARSGVGGTPPAYNSPALTGHEAQMYSGGSPEAYPISNPQSLFREAENVLAVEVHNGSSTSSDMSSIPFLSVLKRDNSGNPPPEVLALPVNYLHTNFRLDADGESLYLCSSDAEIADSLEFTFQNTDHSFGRVQGNDSIFYVFDTPTPGMANQSKAYKGYVSSMPVFSRTGGMFSAPFQLHLESPEIIDTIRYTLDGSKPTSSSAIYSEALAISTNSIVRACISSQNYIDGPVVSYAFFQQSASGLPVVVLATDPENLWDDERGIYVEGSDAESDFPYFGSNFWNDWERPVNVSLYEGDSLAFNIDAGMKIFGGWSRGHPQKSLSIFARSKYGEGKIRYKLFDERPVDEFESFVLRNSGNDWFGGGAQNGTMMRDVLMTRLTKNMNIESQGSKQAIVYLNSEYWGIHNIRDKINEHYLASASGADSDNIELLENNQSSIIGPNTHYAEMIGFIERNSMSLAANYSYVKERMDIQNFINYELAQIYFDNRDWPGNNIKYWRETGPSSKWRWILFDTDFGFGLWDLNKVYYNTLEFAADPSQPGWPNPAWSTFLLRKLLVNDEFKVRFINSFADQINTSFRTDSVQDLISELKQNIYFEMFNHVEKWGGTVATWNNKVNYLNEFAKKRPAAMQNFIRSYFDTGPKHILSLNISGENAGSIGLNSIIVRDSEWNGTYFQDIPITLIALPSPGYRFSGWTGGITSSECRISINLTDAIGITANFVPETNRDARIIINEVCYSSDSIDPTGDWVELYNRSDQYIDISGWKLSDGDLSAAYRIPEGRIMNPNAYLILCKDKYIFSSVHPEVEVFEGNFSFGFSSKGDIAGLLNHFGEPESYFYYENMDPWPEIEPGSGYTLSLLSPELNNYNAASWSRSAERNGTPGRCNFCPLDVPGRTLPELQKIRIEAYPNPFSTVLNIRLTLDCSQHVKLLVFDMHGRCVEVLENTIMQAGAHSLSWQGNHLAAGVYFLRMEVAGSILTRKVVLVR